MSAMAIQGVAPREAPVVRGLPLLGVLPRLVRAGPDLLVEAMETAGPVARLRVGPGSIYLVTHPDGVGRVLVENNRNYWKGRAFNRAGFVFGRGLVLNDGDSWLHQRRLMSPAFAHARVGTLVPIMASVVERKMERWREAARAGRPLEMVHEMMTVTLEVMARTMFSLSVTDADVARLARDFEVALGHLSVRIATFFLPERIPLPGWRKARAAVAGLEGLVRRVVDERRRSGERHGDLLDMLLEARDAATGEAMSERQLRDEVITILFGGYEATADALAWTLFLLASHPEAERRVRAEAAVHVSGDVPTMEELGRLEFTTRVIHESLRLFPPFWWSLREALDDDVVDGVRIPAGASVLLGTYATHRHRDFWEHPDQFDPDRFLPAAVAARHRHAYAPFGAGQRACIGRHMAMLEMQLVLAMVLRAFRPALVPGRPIEARGLASLRARHGVWVTLQEVGAGMGAVV